ncbi:unnamed protein product, partial [Cladocopium goreaui]
EMPTWTFDAAACHPHGPRHSTLRQGYNAGMREAFVAGTRLSALQLLATAFCLSIWLVPKVGLLQAPIPGETSTSAVDSADGVPQSASHCTGVWSAGLNKLKTGKRLRDWRQLRAALAGTARKDQGWLRDLRGAHVLALSQDEAPAGLRAAAEAVMLDQFEGTAPKEPLVMSHRLGDSGFNRVLFAAWRANTQLLVAALPCGAATYKFMEGIAADNGCSCIVLQSLPDADAVGFWRAGGFKVASSAGQADRHKLLRMFWLFVDEDQGVEALMREALLRENHPTALFERLAMSLMGENFYLDNWFMFAKVPLNAKNLMPPQRQLCAGWQFDSGPLSFENVCYVLDYESVRWSYCHRMAASSGWWDLDEVKE